ncbi:hypothetical protein J6590_070916 [Homalodisca vitripennis]|nr:hypothetical protein J6590_070916 [Homalodisca vitripennis]
MSSVEFPSSYHNILRESSSVRGVAEGALSGADGWGGVGIGLFRCGCTGMSSVCAGREFLENENSQSAGSTWHCKLSETGSSWRMRTPKVRDLPDTVNCQRPGVPGE